MRAHVAPSSSEDARQMACDRASSRASYRTSTSVTDPSGGNCRVLPTRRVTTKRTKAQLVLRGHYDHFVRAHPPS